MRAGAPDEVLAGACTYRSRITSWLGGRLLSTTVPIVSGRVTAKADNDIIENLSISVPRWSAAAPGGDVVDWRPGKNADHPLARYGQVLDVTLIVSSVITGDVWETRVGRYQVRDWDDDDEGTISVRGESLLARPRDDSLAVLTSPSGTFISEARRLAPSGVGVSFSPTLVDRPVPGSMAWSKDRLKNLQEIADAWPALLRVDEWGQLLFRDPLPAVPTPVLTVKDGSGGTLISAARSDTRADAPNRVIASTSKTDAPDVSGIAQITYGPMNVNGPYGVVSREWSSPLLENDTQANEAAATMLANGLRPATAVPIRIAPDPRIQIDDPIRVLRGATGQMRVIPANGPIPEHRVWEDGRAETTVGIEELWGYVTAYDLPLTARDGEMRVDVGMP